MKYILVLFVFIFPKAQAQVYLEDFWNDSLEIKQPQHFLYSKLNGYVNDMGSIYYNPIENMYLRNPLYYNCFDTITTAKNDRCFWHFEYYVKGRMNGPIFYLNGRNMLLASGNMKRGKRHGVFNFYCEIYKIPFCDTLSNSPVEQHVYRRGRQIQYIYFGEDKIVVRTRFLFWWRRMEYERLPAVKKPRKDEFDW